MLDHTHGEAGGKPSAPIPSPRGEMARLVLRELFYVEDTPRLSTTRLSLSRPCASGYSKHQQLQMKTPRHPLGDSHGVTY